MKFISSAIAILAGTALTASAWEFDYYCPDALAHPIHSSGSNPTDCRSFYTPCVSSDTINWNTNLFDVGCKLRVYGSSGCQNEARSFGFSDYYGDIGVNARSWKVTGC